MMSSVTSPMSECPGAPTFCRTQRVEYPPVPIALESMFSSEDEDDYVPSTPAKTHVQGKCPDAPKKRQTRSRIEDADDEDKCPGAPKIKRPYSALTALTTPEFPRIYPCIDSLEQEMQRDWMENYAVYAEIERLIEWAKQYVEPSAPSIDEFGLAGPLREQARRDSDPDVYDASDKGERYGPRRSPPREHRRSSPLRE